MDPDVGGGVVVLLPAASRKRDRNSLELPVYTDTTSF
jgi:hypothetical protein